MNIEIFERLLLIVKQLTVEKLFEKIFIVGGACANLHIFAAKGIYGPLSDVDLAITTTKSFTEVVQPIITKLSGKITMEGDKDIFGLYMDGIKCFDVFVNQYNDENLYFSEGLYMFNLLRITDEIVQTIPDIEADIEFCSKEHLERKYKGDGSAEYEEIPQRYDHLTPELKAKLSRYEERLSLLNS